jgi:ABC-type nitrate/sulfonate/bicarbonate transport system substrate-binding protein
MKLAFVHKITLIFFISLATLVYSTAVIAEALSQEFPTIRFCRPNNTVSTLAYVADVQGFFTAEGLNVTFETTTNAKVCQDLMISGHADAMHGSEGAFTYILPFPNPLRPIAVALTIPEPALFARRTRGIETFTDLRGKRIGYLPGTISYLFLARILEKYKIDKAELKLIALQPQAMVEALVGGSIDALVTWEPWGANALIRLGADGIALSETALYSYRGLFYVHDILRKNHPKAVEALLRAEIRAEEFIRHNPDQAMTILARAISIDKKVFQDHWADYDIRIRIDHSTLEILRENLKIIKTITPDLKNAPVPDFTKLFDATFLKNIAPERVEAGF